MLVCFIVLQLELIKGDLELKVEMKCVKEQFLGLLENYTTYEDGRRPPHATRYIPVHCFLDSTTPAPPLPPSTPAHAPHDRPMCRCSERRQQFPVAQPHNVSSSSEELHNRPVPPRRRRPPHEHKIDVSPRTASSVGSLEDCDRLQQLPPQGAYAHALEHTCVTTPQARVRAYCENRRHRLQAKRARHGTAYVGPNTTPNKSTTSYSPASTSTSERHVTSDEQISTPLLSPVASTDDLLEASEDWRNNNTPPKSAPRLLLTSEREEEVVYQNLVEHSLDEDEELLSVSRKTSVADRPSTGDVAPELPPRCPLVPAERYGEYLSHKQPPDDLGEYVTLRAPEQSINSFFECQSRLNISALISPGRLNLSSAPFQTATFTTLSETSSGVSTAAPSHPHTHRDASTRGELRYAKSDVISEMYTKRRSDRSLMDISQISNISGASATPSSLSDSVLEKHPHPLHSTLISARSPLNPHAQACFSDDDARKLNETLDAHDSTLDAEHSMTSTDSYVRTSITSQPRMRSSSHGTPIYESADRLLHERPPSVTSRIIVTSHMNESYDSVLQTPTNNIKEKPILPTSNMEPTLCKEHGLHPVFGGASCIFDDSHLSDGGDSSDLDFTSVNFNQSEAGSGSRPSSKRSSFASTKLSSDKRSSVARHNSAVDTDCDSSYLSECVDDTHHPHDISEAENYTATYDQRRGRMRIMKRQIGHPNIRQKRFPVGLSESDLLEVSPRHVSVNATRASLPNLHDVTTLSALRPSYPEDPYHPYSCDELDDAIHPMDRTLYGSEQGGDFDDNTTVTGVSESVSQRPPLSVCTTTTQATDDSPSSQEQQPGMVVPVNSPNVTDSGGSSSRQATTDDYVDVPANLPKMANMLKQRLASHAQYPSNTAGVRHQVRARRRHPGSSAASSQQSLGSKQSLHICSDPVHEATSNSASRSRHRALRPKRVAHLTSDHAPAARSRHVDHYVTSETSDRVSFIDNTGVRRIINRPSSSSTSHGLDPQRKRAVARKLHQFKHNHPSQLRTLGKF